MKINMYNWLKDIIGSKERKALPILTYPGAKIIGSNVIKMVNDGNLQFKCIKKLSEKFPSVAAVTLMDLSAEAEAFGSPIKFAENEAPTVTSNIVSDMEGVLALKVPEIGTKRIGEYLKAGRLASEAIQDRPVLGGVIGPFSLAGRLFDVSQIIISARRDKETVHLLLNKCNDYIANYITAYKNAGCNGVIIAEPTAGLLSTAMCDEFSSNYIKKIVTELQDENFIIILHNCGHTVKQIASMLSTGCKAFHFGNSVDMADIMPQLPKDIVAFGNIDPSNVFGIGNPEIMHRTATELLEKMADYPNFVLSSGCDVPFETPIENVVAFYGALADYNKKFQ